VRLWIPEDNDRRKEEGGEEGGDATGNRLEFKGRGSRLFITQDTHNKCESSGTSVCFFTQ